MNLNGCWYCQKEDNDLMLSWEFDAYVHLNCAKKAYMESGDDEARIIYEELIGE